MEVQKALIFDIYRGTTHDGPGQRNTVFFKGCPLSCEWCHNPEGISETPLVWWQQRQCIGCLTCVATCKHSALTATEKGIQVNRELCVSCGKCAEECPAEAITLSGTEWSLDELLKDVLKYKTYYDQTNGGVTASGGEAMAQYLFVTEFFKALHENGVTTALDTSGFASSNAFQTILPYTDYILYDLKLIDTELHRKHCGVENGLILENAKRIAAEIRNHSLKSELWIRTPLIPNITATEKNIREISTFICTVMGADAVSRWEMCSFNNSCISKYDRLGTDWEYSKQKLLNKEQTEFLRNIAIQSGFPEEKLFVTGIIAE